METLQMIQLQRDSKLMEWL